MLQFLPNNLEGAECTLSLNMSSKNSFIYQKKLCRCWWGLAKKKGDKEETMVESILCVILMKKLRELTLVLALIIWTEYCEWIQRRFFLDVGRIGILESVETLKNGRRSIDSIRQSPWFYCLQNYLKCLGIGARERSWSYLKHMPVI